MLYEDYCPNCTCDHCAPITEYENRVKNKRDDQASKALKKQMDEARLRADRTALARRQWCMIWLLVNAAHPRRVWDVVETIAGAIGQRPMEINKRRSLYAEYLDDRSSLIRRAQEGEAVRRLTDEGALPNEGYSLPWAKAPGTEGTELPPSIMHCDDENRIVVVRTVERPRCGVCGDYLRIRDRSHYGICRGRS